MEYSPVTLCLEIDRHGKGQDLMVLIQYGQALLDPKLPGVQSGAGKPIILDAQLGQDDAILTIKGRRGAIKTELGENNVLIADPSSSQHFYTVAEIRVTKVWNAKGVGKKGPNKALSVLDISIDINGSSVICDQYVIKNPATSELLNAIDCMTISEIMEKPKDYVVITKQRLVASLDLYEIRDKDASAASSSSSDGNNIDLEAAASQSSGSGDGL
jgi:hypothetical protein